MRCKFFVHTMHTAEFVETEPSKLMYGSVKSSL